MPLRVIDFGTAPPLRSQTLWHALATGVSQGAPPTLSFVQPTGAYVCLGYHRRLDEVDAARCAAAGLPVYRRMVGGGPVYIDDGQLFFQIVVPAASFRGARPVLLRRLLSPAVEAFRAVGIDAHMDDHNEIVVGDRKICGTGAGQIDDAIVVVGNLIDRFDHAAASDTLAVPPQVRPELERLMRRYVLPTPADFGAFRRAAVDSYAAALGLEPMAGAMTAAEEARLAELDRLFEDPRWVAGDPGPPPPTRKVKIRAGVWLTA